MAVGVSAAWAILLWVLSLIEGYLVPNWGVDLHFFHLPYLSNGSPVAQLWVFFVVMLLMFFLGFAPRQHLPALWSPRHVHIVRHLRRCADTLVLRQHLLELVAGDLQLVCPPDGP